jgi:hypothetical protein
VAEAVEEHVLVVAEAVEEHVLVVAEAVEASGSIEEQGKVFLVVARNLTTFLLQIQHVLK